MVAVADGRYAIATRLVNETMEDIGVTCVVSSPDWLRLWPIAFARGMYREIDPFTTALGQDHKLIAEHPYLMHYWST